MTTISANERPSQLGPYAVGDELGRGGMGTVYRARHRETGEEAAVKVLPPELGRSPGFRDRFRREVAALGSLSHPNIVQFFDAGEDDGLAWYAMEFVPGRSLSEVVAERKRLSWEEGVDTALQVCHALRHAHDRGVVHRDLKLSNLLRTPDGQVKLGDFGIARLFDGPTLTAPGGIVGTADYMSPEQAEGRPVGRRSDLYSLGVVLYALVTGRLPFKGKTALDVMRQQRFGQFDRAGAVVPDLPAELDRLINDLMAKDPSRRPPDAYVVARRLDVIRRKAAYRAETDLSGLGFDPEVGPDFALSSGGSSAGPGAEFRPPDRPTPEVDVSSDEDDIPPPAMETRVAPHGLPAARERVSRLSGDDDPEPGARSRYALARERLGAAVLAAVVLGLGALAAWSFWPVSDASLLALGDRLMAADRAEDDRLARDSAFRPLLDRHPTGPWADLARGRLEKLAERTRVRSAGAGVRSPLIASAPPAEVSEAERLYLRAEAAFRSGDLGRARLQFNALADLFGGDAESASWVEAARARSAEIGRRPAEPGARRRRDALRRADALIREKKNDEARRLLRAMVTLYDEDPEARPEVSEARERLNGLDAPARGTEPRPPS